MANLLLPIIAFQVFCFYHIYTRHNPTYWYIIIILFPLLGGLAYFIYHLMNADGKVPELELEPSEESKVPKSSILNLEESVELSDTVSNKLRLADAYMEHEMYDKAVKMYEDCKERYFDDEEIDLKLMNAYYYGGDFLSTIVLGRKIQDEMFFRNAKERVLFAWAFFELHDDENAEANFEAMNIEGSNYYHRKEYFKFLLETEQYEKAKNLAALLSDEIKEMGPFERRIHKKDIAELKALKIKIANS